MILSTQTDVTARRYGLVRAVEMIAEAGFDAADISMFEGEENEWIFAPGFEKTIKEAVKAAEANGIFFNQAHAPFPSYRVGDEEYNKRIRPRLERAIEAAGMAGVKNIVVHPVVFGENNKRDNIKMYNELLDTAKEAGVKIALENMWGRDPRRGYIMPNVCSTAEELADFCDALDPEWFTVCLDIGHVGLVGEFEAPFIRTLGHDRLTCLHVHDNDYVHDSHVCPCTMKLPWNDICGALADIDYVGDLTLEADNTLKPLPDALIPAGLRMMHDAGRYLIGMIENRR